MAPARSMSSVGAIVLCLVLSLCFATTLAGREFQVGDNKGGWTFGVSGWENGKAFSAGDVLVFKYNPSAHNVVEVDGAGYNKCLPGGGAKTYRSGEDRITLSRGQNFFICSFPGHCEQRMKIAVTAN